MQQWGQYSALCGPEVRASSTSGVCLFTTLLALLQLFNLHACVCCVLTCTVCAEYLAYAFHIMYMSNVMSVMLPCSCLLVEPGFHTSVGLGCVLHCIYVHKSLHAFGACRFCPRHCGVRPIKMRPFCAGQVTGGFFNSHRLRTSAHSGTQLLEPSNACCKFTLRIRVRTLTMPYPSTKLL